MLSIQRITPFYTSQEDFRLRLVFAYQYFSIFKRGEVFQFIPSEGKEIIINMKSLQVENSGEIFVFQRGNRFIRFPLYQLLIISDLPMYLRTIIERVVNTNAGTSTEVEIPEAIEIIRQFEAANRLRMIDYALETNNILLFNELMEGLQQK
ncbi:transcriptional regulator [Sporosarcina limicola]|uniref:Uncharacterized protein n=1 Tax=Sporosarcina limicola TaxID=34101 RepID=A0A927RDU3_9BACL|nr:transcriptional regulator [Sporosarcina limicola]MBE1555675.1 hypothetical protein [Sporosarcina limicola]